MCALNVCLMILGNLCNSVGFDCKIPEHRDCGCAVLCGMNKATFGYNLKEYNSYIEYFNKAHFARTNVILKVNRANNLHLVVLSRDGVILWVGLLAATSVHTIAVFFCFFF